jgi:hypothetical protein
MSEHIVHIGHRTIRDAHGRYPAMPFARCTCGWEGPGRLDRDTAIRDSEAHREDPS